MDAYITNSRPTDNNNGTQRIPINFIATDPCGTPTPVVVRAVYINNGETIELGISLEGIETIP